MVGVAIGVGAAATAGAGIYEAKTASDSAASARAQQAKLDQESLDLQKEKLNYAKQHDAQQLQFAQQQLDRQLGFANKALNESKSLDHYRRGLVNSMIDNATFSPGEYQKASNQAGADVTQSFAHARKARKADLAKYGINPNSGAFAGMDRASQVQEAAARAGAETGTRMKMKTESRNAQRQARMAGLRVPSTAAAADEAAANITNPQLQLHPLTPGAYSSAISNTANMANSFGNQANNYRNMEYSAISGAAGGVGSLLGYGLSYGSGGGGGGSGPSAGLSFGSVDGSNSNPAEWGLNNTPTVGLQFNK